MGVNLWGCSQHCGLSVSMAHTGLEAEFAPQGESLDPPQKAGVACPSMDECSHVSQNPSPCTHCLQSPATWDSSVREEKRPSGNYPLLSGEGGPQRPGDRPYFREAYFL